MIWYTFLRATFDHLGELVGIYDEWAMAGVHLWLGLGLGIVYGLGLWSRLGNICMAQSIFFLLEIPFLGLCCCSHLCT